MLKLSKDQALQKEEAYILRESVENEQREKEDKLKDRKIEEQRRRTALQVKKLQQRVEELEEDLADTLDELANKKIEDNNKAEALKIQINNSITINSSQNMMLETPAALRAAQDQRQR